jgi:hypothetical protein
MFINVDEHHYYHMESRDDILKELSEIRVNHDESREALNTLVIRIKEIPDSLWPLIYSNVFNELDALIRNYKGVVFGTSPKDHAILTMTRMDGWLELFEKACRDSAVEQYFEKQKKGI